MRSDKSLLLSIIILILIFYGFVYYHETIHEQISKQHGCIKGEKYITFGHAYFICVERSSLYYEPGFMLQEKKLHSINEIVGYHVKILMILVTGFYLLWRINKNENN